jgi:hypothetical protein
MHYPSIFFIKSKVNLSHENLIASVGLMRVIK